MGKQILGYVQHEENKHGMMGKVDSLFEKIEGLSVIENIKEFASNGEDFILLMHSLDDLKLQLIQFFPILEMVKEQGQVIRFVEQGLAEPLTDEVYFNIMVELATNEKRTMQHRYEKSKIQAIARGKTFGRPVIDSESIERIQYLYKVEKRSIREISQKCGISVGTVHKYIKQVR